MLKLLKPDGTLLLELILKAFSVLPLVEIFFVLMEKGQNHDLSICRFSAKNHTYGK